MTTTPPRAKLAATKAMTKAVGKATIDMLTDAQLLSDFSKVTGCVALGCKHCHKTEMPLENFTIGIRRKAEKGGLCPDMKLPMTCDKQMRRSDENNLVANKLYYRIKKAKTPEDAIAARSELDAYYLTKRAAKLGN